MGDAASKTFGLNLFAKAYNAHPGEQGHNFHPNN